MLIAFETSAAGDLVFKVVMVLAFLFYFTPALIAAFRGHHQVGAIVAVNLLLGWLLIPWVVALAMALSAKREPAVVQNFMPAAYPAQPYVPQHAAPQLPRHPGHRPGPR
jgi:hypothetical protein